MRALRDMEHRLHWHYGQKVMSIITFNQVSRQYGSSFALKDVNFAVGEGQFFAMLGPSGSGKTTSLRLISGFDQPTHGEVKLRGTPIQNVAPYRRPVNTVFQDYALFPHLSILDNVAYGLKIKGMGKTERHQKALEMLNVVQLTGRESHKPSALSGGQRQRVALARALVNEPQILLLDEPLGALDLKLRESMQAELRQLQQRLGITFIYVTHDQGEALSMADSVAVFNEGRIEQVAPPEVLYNQPATAFVAQFVGSANVLAGALQAQLQLPTSAAIRAEYIAISTQEPSDAVKVQARIAARLYQGAQVRFECETADGSVILVSRPSMEAQVRDLREGQTVWLSWDAAQMVLLKGAS
ncbi:MAG: ABC transporter ATP-binding protein [Formosimonas sp.]